MDSKELNIYVKEDARGLGLCDRWYNGWDSDAKQDDLLDMMYKGIDFCLKHHWPSNQFLKENGDIKILRAHGVLVDEKRSALNPSKCLVLGQSDVIIRYNGSTNGVAYLRDNSKVKVSAKNRAFVIIHVFDNVQVEAEQTDSAHLVIIKHSENISVSTTGNVTIREEYNYLS